MSTDTQTPKRAVLTLRNNHDISKLKTILITHGHFDHYGSADAIRKLTGAKIYMSKIDYECARTNADGGPGGPLPWEVDGFVSEGDVFTVGDTQIHAVATPGHSWATMSYIFNVTDEGRPHMTSLWGGTGVPRKLSDKLVYLRSCRHFAEWTERFCVDCEVTNHPFIDASLQRMEVLRTMHDGVPNPFVLGKENYKYYENSFEEMCLKAIEAQVHELEKGEE